MCLKRINYLDFFTGGSSIGGLKAILTYPRWSPHLQLQRLVQKVLGSHQLIETPAIRVNLSIQPSNLLSTLPTRALEHEQTLNQTEGRTSSAFHSVFQHSLPATHTRINWFINRKETARYILNSLLFQFCMIVTYACFISKFKRSVHVEKYYCYFYLDTKTNPPSIAFFK